MKRHLGKLIALLCGLALWVFGVAYQGLPQTPDSKEWFRVLSNGALLPGVLFVGISGLTWIAGDGMFDGLAYSMRTLITHLRREKKKYASYYDYTQREKKRGTYPMLLPGLFFLAAAMVLTLLFYI